jgi:hypothetical protein
MDSSRKSASEGDLVLVAQAFLEERIDFGEFRRLLLDTWVNLRRGALPAGERRAWAEIVSAARSTTPEDATGGSPHSLYDSTFFRDSLLLVLGTEPRRDRTTRSRRAREIRDAIAKVLLEEWDPIGVSDVPEASDEYDSYIAEMYRLVASRERPEAIAARLVEIEANLMGLPPMDPRLRLSVARSLLALDVNLQPRAG